jgi:hypothetical protein
MVGAFSPVAQDRIAASDIEVGAGTGCTARDAPVANKMLRGTGEELRALAAGANEQ